MTEATIEEVLRCSSLVPLALQHRAMEDTWLGKYFIPKDTLIVGNLFAAHTQEGTWKNPAEFHPRRFLTPDGLLRRNEALLPFSTGKRKCLGERFARDEIFLYLTSIFQNFRVSPANNTKIPLDCFVSTTITPKPFHVIFSTLEKVSG